MAHQLEVVNGKASTFYVGQTPWHGLGQALQSPPTVEEGLRAAGLDWKVGLKPLFTDDKQAVDHRATYRMDNGRILGVVGPWYHPLQNLDAFGWFQPFLDSGEAELHTGGCLQDGRKVWVLARMRREGMEIADGDTVERFILLSNSHDGTRAVRVGFTPIRVVCANTLALAHSDKEQSSLIRLLHTKGLQTSLDELRKTMNTANAAFEATAKQYRRLAKARVSQADLRRYVKVVLGVENTTDEDMPKPTLDKIERMLRNANEGRGNDMVKGTLWAGYNGVTEYFGYEFGRSVDARLNSLWWGTNARLNQRALEVALTMAT